MGAKLSPFLDPPEVLIERLAGLKLERAKIEAQEDRIREKLKSIMLEKKVEILEGPNHVVKIERRESVDRSEATCEKVFGFDVWDKMRFQLPTKVTESLVLREKKEAEREGRNQETQDFFAKKKNERKAQ